MQGERDMLQGLRYKEELGACETADESQMQNPVGVSIFKSANEASAVYLDNSLMLIAAR